MTDLLLDGDGNVAFDFGFPEKTPLHDQSLADKPPTYDDLANVYKPYRCYVCNRDTRNLAAPDILHLYHNFTGKSQTYTTCMTICCRCWDYYCHPIQDR